MLVDVFALIHFCSFSFSSGEGEDEGADGSAPRTAWVDQAVASAPSQAATVAPRLRSLSQA